MKFYWPRSHPFAMTDDSPTTDGEAVSSEGPSSELTRRSAMAALGLLGGAGALVGGASASSGGGDRPWRQDVDANGHTLSDLGALSTSASGTSIRDFAGQHLSVDDDGVLNANELPDSVHVVNNYPGETLDQKLTAAIEEAVETGGTQPGHRILVPPPAPDDPASIDGGSIWRFESPVVIDEDVGKLTIEMGWTLAFATAPIESFFVVGPDEKTENVTLDGGFLYARGNVETAFLDVQGIGHMDIENLYCQSLEGRNTVPAGIRITTEGGGTSGVEIEGCEVTGCTRALHARGVFDLDVSNWRGGGGEHSIVLDGCEGVGLRGIQTGGAPIQSVTGDVVRLENGAAPNDNVTVIDVREENNRYGYATGVNAADVTGGEGGKHRGVDVYGVNLEAAEHSTDLGWAVNFDQQALTPAPADASGDGTTRFYHGGTQTFASSRHEFRAGGDPSLVVGEDDVEVAGAGNGAVLTTPDGQNRYRLRVDNDGTVVTEEVEEQADRSGVVDSFEDGDLSEYAGATDAYEVTTGGLVADGDYSLKKTASGTAIFGSVAGLSRYPQAGDTFSADAAWTDVEPNLGVAFGMQDLQNFYFARIYPGGDPTNDDPDDDHRLQLYKRVDGDYTQLDEAVLTAEKDTLYEFVVDWGTNGEITVDVNAPDGSLVGSMSAIDTTFTEGGVGARRTGVLDDIRIL